MKKHHIMGIATATLGLLLLIASVVPIWSAIGFSVDIFNILENISYAPTDMAMAGVFGLLTMIGGIALFIYGVLIAVMPKFLHAKALLISTIVVSLFAVVASICAMATTTNSMSAAPIMWLIFGIVGIASAFVTPMIARNKD